LTAVPRWVVGLLAVALASQLAWRGQSRPQVPEASELPPAPRAEVLRIAAFGEPATLARLLMLYLQAFDYHGTNTLPYRNLDYKRLTAWLGAILALDPLSEYPLFIAARVYAEIPDPQRQRIMLDFILSEFQSDPNRRWPWATHAALVAKHQLKDLPLALKYARAVDHLTTAPDVPLWAKQMEIFILEDMNELDAASVMVGGLLASGRISDPGERRFLQGRLKELKERQGALRR